MNHVCALLRCFQSVESEDKYIFLLNHFCLILETIDCTDYRKMMIYIFSYKLHFWASNEYEQLIQSYLLTFQDLPVTCVLVKTEVDISHVNQTFVSKEVIYRIDGITSFLSRSKSTNRIVDLRKVYAYRNETGTQLKQFVDSPPSYAFICYIPFHAYERFSEFRSIVFI